MLLKANYKKILDYYFSDKKFKTANRIFFEAVEELRNDNNFNFDCPWTVSWQLTSACNLRCKHCFFAGNERIYNSSNNLKTAEILNLIDELSDLNVVAVSLSGGEVLLRNDLFTIIEKLKTKNIAVSLQTNGTLLTPEIAETLAQLLNPYVDYIQVSMDSIEKDIFEQIRGIGTFEKTVEGIQCLIQNGINVNINYTVLTLNKDTIPQTYKWADKVGIKKMSVSRFIPSYTEHQYIEPDFSSIINPLAETIEIAENKNTFLEMNYKFYDFIETQKLRKFADEYLKSKKILTNQNISCHKHNTLFINANGEFFLCYNCSMNEGFLGKYPELPMKEIWANRKDNIFFKTRLAKFSACKACKYFSYCKSGCMGNAFSKYKSIYAKDSLCKYDFSSK